MSFELSLGSLEIAKYARGEADGVHKLAQSHKPDPQRSDDVLLTAYDVVCKLSIYLSENLGKGADARTPFDGCAAQKAPFAVSRVKQPGRYYYGR